MKIKDLLEMDIGAVTDWLIFNQHDYELYEKDDWISVKDSLPFDDEGESDKSFLSKKFLVCVESKYHKPMDERKVMILEFHGENDEWRLSPSKPYDFGWIVVGWKELPEPI